jgi:hypothetical protein
LERFGRVGHWQTSCQLASFSVLKILVRAMIAPRLTLF